MRRVIGFGALGFLIAAALVGTTALGKLSVSDACSKMLANASQWQGVHPTAGMQRDCELFFTHYARAEQTKALQCMAKAKKASAFKACQSDTAPLEKPSMNTPLLEPAESEQGNAGTRQGSRVAIATLSEEVGAKPVLSERMEGESLGGLGRTDEEVGSGGIGFGPGGQGNAGKSGGFAPKTHTPVAEFAGVPTVTGPLAPSLIEYVVKRHLNAIRYCYQRELLKSADLQGTLTVRFTIQSDGKVTSSQTQDSTLNNEAVDSCVATRFTRMQFPYPDNGETVTVLFPLKFNSKAPEEE